MELTKEQWTELNHIYYNICSSYSCAKFPEVVKVVEDFLTKRPLDWQPGAPALSGRYFLITEQIPLPHDYPYDPDDAEWDTDEVLFHFGPIPPAPKIDRT